jgi:chromosome partitioning protein
MPVIALVGNKGGAGKTTLCVNLACALAKRQPTIIVDADPQQSSLQWFRMGGESASTRVVAGSDDVAGSLASLDAGMHYRLIDCPPSAQSAQMQQALELADLAIVPVLPSPLDIWATVHVEQVVRQARRVNPALKTRLVVNQFESRTRLSKATQQALAELEIPAAKTIIRRRAIYRQSLIDGRSVHDMGSQGVDAVNEIQDLINEIRL